MSEEKVVEEQLSESSSTSSERGRSRSGSRTSSRKETLSEESTGAKPKRREPRSRSIGARPLWTASPRRRHLSKAQLIYNPELEKGNRFARISKEESDSETSSPSGQRPDSPDVPPLPDPLNSYFPNLTNSAGPCCGCTSEYGVYYFGTYICYDCLTQVQEIIRNGGALACNDSHNGPRLCAFCLMEEVYRHTSADIILAGFTRMTFDANYLPVRNPSGYYMVKEKISEGDEHFMAFYRICMNDLLRWIRRQEQIYLFEADERIKLLSENGLAAVLMLMSIQNVTIHNVIRGYRRYIDPYDCTSEILRLILANIYRLGSMYEEMGLRPEHLYFVKLLALFQPEFVRIEKADDFGDTIAVHYDKKRGLVNKFENLKFLTDSYWFCLNEMELDVRELKIINKSIYSMRNIAKWMKKVWASDGLAYLEPFDISLQKWLASYQHFTNDNVIVGYGFSDIPEAAFEVCDKTNRLTLKNFRAAQDLLRHHFTRFDQSILMEHNFLKYNVIHLAFSGYWEELVVCYEPFFELRDMLVNIRKNFRQLRFGITTPHFFLKYFFLFDPCQIFYNNIRHCPFEKFQDLFVRNMAFFLKMDLKEAKREFSPGYDYSLEDLMGKVSNHRNPAEKEALKDLFKLVNFFLLEGSTKFPFLINLNIWLGDQ